ncbi:hypothetical protein [Microbulbifer aggregans]|uniref:hypothetical protein n=1 Tax=Microbulbifer aggregans TaxID=1769779 RepID=UPI001CFD7791|nr:hypothetical protein [Microbulbifer aggregans]
MNSYNIYDELNDLRGKDLPGADFEPTFQSEAEAQQWAATQSLAASHAEIDRQYAEKRRQEQYATPTGALYDADGRLQERMTDDTIIEIAGATMRLGDAKTAGLVDGDGFYSDEGEEVEEGAEEYQTAQVLQGQLRLAESLVGADALERCLDDDTLAIEELSAKAGCSVSDTIEMLGEVVDQGMDTLEEHLSFHLPGYDIDRVLDVATSSPKGAAEVRRAAVGLARGSAVTFNQLLERYAKDYGFKIR